MKRNVNLSDEHVEEVKLISRIMNSKLFIAIFPVILAVTISWITLAANYSSKVDEVIKQGKDKAKIDSVNFQYMKEKK